MIVGEGEVEEACDKVPSEIRRRRDIKKTGGMRVRMPSKNSLRGRSWWITLTREVRLEQVGKVGCEEQAGSGELERRSGERDQGIGDQIWAEGEVRARDRMVRPDRVRNGILVGILVSSVGILVGGPAAAARPARHHEGWEREAGAPLRPQVALQPAAPQVSSRKAFSGGIQLAKSGGKRAVVDT